MPELPEIEVIVRGLRPLVVGRRIVDYDTRQPKAINLPLDALRERGRQEVKAVHRNGKSAVLGLETAELWIHLGLEGKVLWVPPGAPLPPTQPMVSIAFDDGARFRLERTFMGHVHLLDADASEERVANLGIDPLADSLAEWLVPLAERRPGLGCKAFLMDQSLVAGVGNVYSDEALHRAGLHPARKLGSLSADDLHRLWATVREVLSESVEKGGDESYADLSGRPGTFTSRVHGRKDCVTCGGPTVKQAFGGRSGYLCPACQGSPS